jgi:hypothetical protein
LFDKEPQDKDRLMEEFDELQKLGNFPEELLAKNTGLSNIMNSQGGGMPMPGMPGMPNSGTDGNGGDMNAEMANLQKLMGMAGGEGGMPGGKGPNGEDCRIF